MMFAGDRDDRGKKGSSEVGQGGMGHRGGERAKVVSKSDGNWMRTSRHVEG